MHLGDIFRGVAGSRTMSYYPIDKMREAHRDIFGQQPEYYKEEMTRFPAVMHKLNSLIDELEQKAEKKEDYQKILDLMDLRSKFRQYNAGYTRRLEITNYMIDNGLITDEELQRGVTIKKQELKDYLEKHNLLIEYTKKFPRTEALKELFKDHPNGEVIAEMRGDIRKEIQLATLEVIKKITEMWIAFDPSWSIDEIRGKHLEMRQIVYDFHDKYDPILKEQLDKEIELRRELKK
jgi:hypothetical protein